MVSCFKKNPTNSLSELLSHCFSLLALGSSFVRVLLHRVHERLRILSDWTGGALLRLGFVDYSSVVLRLHQKVLDALGFVGGRLRFFDAEKPVESCNSPRDR